MEIKKIKVFWDFTLIPIFMAIYYICRYGLKGAEQKVDEMYEEEKRELEQLFEGLRLDEDA